MAKDDRLYFKLTLDFPDHAKILPLSDAAFRCLVEAIAYSRKHLTDGKLARRYALARWGPEVLAELSANDPVKPSLIEREDAWYIHDFDTINDTAAEVEARRVRNRKAGKQGGLAKAKQVASKSLSNSVSENVAETETETETETFSPLVKLGRVVTLSNAREPRCPKHLNDIGPIPPCHACADIRRAQKVQEDIAEREAKQAAIERRKKINDCNVCDENGLVETRSGMLHCDHQRVPVDA